MRYEVSNPINKPFEKEDAVRRDKTITVTFYKENGGLKGVVEYGYISEEEYNNIYDQINSGEEINLNYTYIKKFSLGTKRKNHEMTIKGLNAKKAFFDSCVSFSRIKFGDGKVDFSGTYFGEGDVDFSNTKFGEGDVDFSGTKFGEGNVYFLGTKFGEGDVDFSGANFGKGNVLFSGAIMGKGEADFSSSNFGEGNVYFLGTKFGEGSVYFSATEFGEGDVDFSKAKFGEGDVKFLNANCQNLLFRNVIFKGHTDIRLAKCEKLILSDCIIEKTLKLQNKNYRNNQESCFNSLNILYTKNLGQIYIDWENDKVKELIDNYYVMNPHVTYPNAEKASQFILLKENFRNIGQYNDEDNSYVEYKRCKRKDRLEKFFEENCMNNKKYWKDDSPLSFFLFLLFGILHLFDYLILDKVGGYGTKPKNVFATMIVTIMGFTAIYQFVPGLISHPTVSPDSEVLKFDRLWDSFYHSIITFFTVGYGETLPTSRLGIFLSGFESFIGVFLMSYFTVAFVRKILR